MARPVGGGCAAIRLAALAKVKRLPAERALVDLPFLGPGERETEVLELKVRQEQ